MCHTHSPERLRGVLVVWKNSHRLLGHAPKQKELLLSIGNFMPIFCSSNLWLLRSLACKPGQMSIRQGACLEAILCCLQCMAVLKQQIYLQVLKKQITGTDNKQTKTLRCQPQRLENIFSYNVGISLYVFLLQHLLSSRIALPCPLSIKIYCQEIILAICLQIEYKNQGS